MPLLKSTTLFLIIIKTNVKSSKCDRVLLPMFDSSNWMLLFLEKYELKECVQTYAVDVEELVVQEGETNEQNVTKAKNIEKHMKKDHWYASPCWCRGATIHSLNSCRPNSFPKISGTSCITFPSVAASPASQICNNSFFSRRKVGALVSVFWCCSGGFGLSLRSAADACAWPCVFRSSDGTQDNAGRKPIVRDCKMPNVTTG